MPLERTLPTQPANEHGQLIARPVVARALPVLVSIPHYGTRALPGVTAADYADPAYVSFAYGYADAFAADLYGGLEATGATVAAFTYSRLFVDVNRRRDDFDVCEGRVHSQRGVMRTHAISQAPLFTCALSEQQAEQRLKAFYDPWHATLRGLVEQLHERHGRLLLIDAHTGSERRMGEHQVILGTRRGATCDRRLTDLAADAFRSHAFTVDFDVPGYSGGYTVRHYAEPQARHVHALQIELNSSLMMAGSRQAFMEQVRSGAVPACDRRNLARLRTCVETVIADLSEALPTLP